MRLGMDGQKLQHVLLAPHSLTLTPNPNPLSESLEQASLVGVQKRGITPFTLMVTKFRFNPSNSPSQLWRNVVLF